MKTLSEILSSKTIRIKDTYNFNYFSMELTSPFYVIMINDTTFYILKNKEREIIFKNRNIEGLLLSVKNWRTWQVGKASLFHENELQNVYINLDICNNVYYSYFLPFTYIENEAYEQEEPLIIVWQITENFIKNKGEIFTVKDNFFQNINKEDFENNNYSEKEKSDMYLYVRVKFENSNRLYWYISNNKDVQIGQTVRINNQYGTHLAKIVFKKYYTINDAPYPPEKTKYI